MERWRMRKKIQVSQQQGYYDYSSNGDTSHTWSHSASAKSIHTRYTGVNNTRLNWKRKKKRASREPGYNDYSSNADSSHPWSQSAATKSTHIRYADVNNARLSRKRKNTQVSQEPGYNKCSKIPYNLSKEFRLRSKSWKKEWGYGAEFIEWQEKNNLDGAVVDLTVATESVLTGKNKCVINLVDEEDDHNNATGMFGIKKRKFTFCS